MEAIGVTGGVAGFSVPETQSHLDRVWEWQTGEEPWGWEWEKKD